MSSMAGRRPVRPTAPLSHEGATQYRVDEDTPAVGQDRPNVADGEVRTRIFPGEVRDDFYLSPEDKQAYGIDSAIPSSLADTDMPGDRVLVAIRAPERYGKYEPGHLRAKKRSRPSLQVVTDANGNPVYATEDLIFATQDRKEYLERKQRHNEASYQFTRGVIDGQLEHGEAQNGMIENFRGSDPRYLSQEYKKSHAQLATMKDKWPKNMGIEDIEKHVGAEATLRLERKWARNGRSERPGEYDAYEQRMAEARNKSGSKNKSFSFPGQATK